MTPEQLIIVSTRELEKLPADELEIITRHFETEDRALLARRLADEAEEMWSGDHEAPVPQAEWPSAHLQLLLDKHRDDKREALLADRRRIAAAVIDGLVPARRALLCWRFHTTVQQRLVALVTDTTVQSMEDGLVKETSFEEAASDVIVFEIDQQIDEVESQYYKNGGPKSSQASPAEYPEVREIEPSTRAAGADSASNPAITPANDPPVRASVSKEEESRAEGRAKRGDLPDTVAEFAAYDSIVRHERHCESTDEVMATLLVSRVKERVALNRDPEIYVIATFGDDYVSARTEAILLRQAGWDAVPLLLEKPALAVAIEGAVVAVRDMYGRLAIHPMRRGALNHLIFEVDRAESRTLHLREAITFERKLPEQLARFAMELWASARGPAPAGPPRGSGAHQSGSMRAGQWMERPVMLTQNSGIAMAAEGPRKTRKMSKPAPHPSGQPSSRWDAIAAEVERRVIEKDSELVATMDRILRIYSGGRLAGRRVRPGTIVVERVSGVPEFPSLVFPNLASIADGFNVGAAVAIVGLMPLGVELAGWVDPGDKPTPEGDRRTAALEDLGEAYSAGRVSPEEFEATRNAHWDEAERAGVAVEMAWRLHAKGGRTREPAIASSLSPVPVRAMPHLRYLLELHLRQIPSDAHASVISRWVRPSDDQIEAGQGAWQHAVVLIPDGHSTCSQCPFVLGSNLDCETCRTWVLSLKRPGVSWTAERIGAAIYNCDEPAVAIAAVEALAQSTQAPLTMAFFREFADNFEVCLTKHVKPDDMNAGDREHCRRAVEWLLPQPDFPLPVYPPSKGTPRKDGNADILMRAAPLSAKWRN